MLVPINLDVMEAVFNNMKDRVTYEMGAKAPSMDCDSSDINTIDCSGFVRYVLAKSTAQQMIIPDGSDNENSYFESLVEAFKEHKLTEYSDVQYATDDIRRLFVGIIHPGAEGPGESGHIWLIREGTTRESHGADAHGNGVDSRPWDTSVLKTYCGVCYELPTNLFTPTIGS